MNHIKVNFPSCPSDFEQGYGEGMWVIVDDETKQAHDNDATGGMYEGVLDNDSIDWIGLEHGVTVPFEMRGDKRPVVPFEWLNERYDLDNDVLPE